MLPNYWTKFTKMVLGSILFNLSIQSKPILFLVWKLMSDYSTSASDCEISWSNYLIPPQRLFNWTGIVEFLVLFTIYKVDPWVFFSLFLFKKRRRVLIGIGCVSSFNLQFTAVWKLNFSLFSFQPVEEPEKMTQIIVEALQETGQRGIINKGWGGLGNCKFLVTLYLFLERFFLREQSFFYILTCL